jgi:type IV pilus assembly protein PilB
LPVRIKGKWRIPYRSPNAFIPVWTIGALPRKRKRLGQALVEDKRISNEILEKIIQEQEASDTPLGFLGELLLQRELVSSDDLVAALEEVTRFRFVDPRFATVEKAVLELVPHASAVRYCVLPLIREGSRIITAMAEPQNLQTIDDLRFLTGMDISPRLGVRSDILAAIEKCYAQQAQDTKAEQDKLPFIEQVDVSVMQFFTVGSSEKSQAAIEEFEAELRNERTPAVRLVSAILYAAASKRASDIYIEPQGESTTVRIRVDGMLRELTHIPKELQASVISRVKILSDMDIAERRAPQDGRFQVKIAERSLDLRASTLPTHYGEKVVMRLLDPAATRVAFGALGFSAENAKTLNAALSGPQGMLLVTGPTGSETTTTLYSALNSLRSPTVNIITVEDPIEYKIEDINQVQVNPKAGLTFANCLRSILR